MAYGSRVLTRQRHDDNKIIVVGDGYGHCENPFLSGQSRFFGLLMESH